MHGYHRIAGTVVVISSHPLAGQFIASHLRRTGSSETFVCREALPRRFAESSARMVFILDKPSLTFPISEGISRLRKRFPSAKHIIVDQELTDDDVVQLLRLGAHGYIGYAEIPSFLGKAIRKVIAGGLWISNRVFAKYVDVTCLHDRNLTAQVITPRETQVLELLSRRLSNKEIGNVLNLEESTVKYHVSNLLSKLQIASRRQIPTGSRVLPIWDQLALKD